MHLVRLVDREAEHFHLLFEFFFGLGLEHGNDKSRGDVSVDLPEYRGLGRQAREARSVPARRFLDPATR